MEYLLFQGARLDAGDDSDVTSIMFAAGGGHEACLDILLAAVDDAAAAAADEGDESNIFRLLDTADVDGNTASHYACRAGEDGTLSLLADAGACIDLPAGSSAEGTGLHPSHLAVVYGFLFCLEELASRGVDLEATDEDGDTLLSLAVQCGSEACAEFLLSTGVPGGLPLVDPNRPGRGEERPLNAAARRGRLSFMSLLVRAGASPAAQDGEGETAVHAAARSGQVGFIEALAQAGIPGENDDGEEGGEGNNNDDAAGSGEDKDMKGSGLPTWWFTPTNSGETATFIAAHEGHAGVCRTLRAIQALEPSRPNAEGVTPMVAAALAGHSEVCCVCCFSVGRVYVVHVLKFDVFRVEFFFPCFLCGSDFDPVAFSAVKFAIGNSLPVRNITFIVCAEFPVIAETNCYCCGLAPQRDASGALHSA